MQPGEYNRMKNAECRMGAGPLPPPYASPLGEVAAGRWGYALSLGSNLLPPQSRLCRDSSPEGGAKGGCAAKALSLGRGWPSASEAGCGDNDPTSVTAYAVPASSPR